MTRLAFGAWCRTRRIPGRVAPEVCAKPSRSSSDARAAMPTALALRPKSWRRVRFKYSFPMIKALGREIPCTRLPIARVTNQANYSQDIDVLADHAKDNAVVGSRDLTDSR